MMINLNVMLLFCRYGVGMIYYKQEKFSLAEMHYRKALAINPQSSVLLCHIGVVSSTFSIYSSPFLLDNTDV